MQDEREVVRKVGAGDVRAFEALFARYHEPIRRHVRRVVRDPATAEDLTQEVFERVWTRAGQWNGRGTFQAWLFRVATNLALNQLRSQRRRPQGAADCDGRWSLAVSADKPSEAWLVDPAAVDPSDAAERGVDRDRVRQLLTGLPDDKRRVLELVHIADMDLATVAEVLGIPVGTVKSRLYYARKRLAQAWRELDGDDWEE